MTREAVDRNRRAFLRGRIAREGTPRPLRPPWAREAFESACTRCGACLAACPEGILHPGDGGFPEVDFRRGTGECTFCAACAASCPEPAFVAAPAGAPWHATARIQETCLALRGVHCQSCGDACGESAITFRPTLGGAPRPAVDAASCTGCGACVGACPVDALVVTAQGTTGHG